MNSGTWPSYNWHTDSVCCSGPVGGHISLKYSDLRGIYVRASREEVEGPQASSPFSFGTGHTAVHIGKHSFKCMYLHSGSYAGVIQPARKVLPELYLRRLPGRRMK